MLTGGNLETVVRVGDTVRRMTGPWTPAVHQLLLRFPDAGIRETPRVLGRDDQHREVLTFIPGDVMTSLPPELRWSDTLLREAGAVLRRLHDASESLVDLAGPWRQPSRQPAEVVCLNDVAPYNLIVRDGRLVGVIDLDMASPGPRLWDLAYLAYRLVPWAEDAADYDPARDGTRRFRLTALMEAYRGTFTHEAVRASAVERLERLADDTRARADHTGRLDLAEHAAMYRRDADRLRALG